MKMISHPNITRLISGDKRIIDRMLRVSDETARFDQDYQYGMWDGFRHFFDPERGEFPTGLLWLVKKRLEKKGIPLNIKRKYQVPKCRPIDADFLNGVTLRDYQLTAVNRCLKKHTGYVKSPTGSGKTAQIAGVAGALFLQHGLRTLIMVPSVPILTQTVKELQSFLGDGVTVGRMGGGKKQYDADVTVATPQTLRFALPEIVEKNGDRVKTTKNDPRLLNLIRQAGCLIIDETQHASADTWFQIAQLCPAVFRFGFSATPKKGKLWEDRRLNGIVGKNIYTVEKSLLVERGTLAAPTMYLIDDPALKKCPMIRTMDYHEAFTLGILEFRRYNKAVARIARHVMKKGKPPLVLSHRVGHLKLLARILDHNNVPNVILHGEHSADYREQVKQRFVDGEEFVLLASTVFDEGVDIPNIRVVILAGGGKSLVAFNQRVGRGMRIKKEDNTLSVIDFTHKSSKLLAKHARERLKMFEADGFPVITVNDVKSLSQYSI